MRDRQEEPITKKSIVQFVVCCVIAVFMILYT